MAASHPLAAASHEAASLPLAEAPSLTAARTLMTVPTLAAAPPLEAAHSPAAANNPAAAATLAAGPPVAAAPTLARAPPQTAAPALAAAHLLAAAHTAAAAHPLAAAHTLAAARTAAAPRPWTAAHAAAAASSLAATSSVEAPPLLTAATPVGASPSLTAVTASAAPVSPAGGPTLSAPARSAAALVPWSSRTRTAFVALLLDFETAEHDGALKAMAHAFDGTASTYAGRIVGCRVHRVRFLLKRCGNDERHPFCRSVLALRDSPPQGGMFAVEVRLTEIMERSRAAGEQQPVAVLKWFLDNDAARMAAFALSVGTLTRTEILAAGETTNAAEALNKLTQVEVKQNGARTFLGAVQALMDFDAFVMDQVRPAGQASSVGGALEQARLRQNLKWRQQNTVPPGGAPPKPRRARRPAKERLARGVASVVSEGNSGQATPDTGRFLWQRRIGIRQHLPAIWVCSGTSVSPLV